jgi:hypothetical protein
MGYIDSLSATISCVLTKAGKLALAKNDNSFRITKFKVSDDEINYQLYNPGSIDSEDSDIINIPILEPSTNQDAALRYPLVTMAEGTIRVAELTINPSNVVFNLSSQQDEALVQATTLYNEDQFYIINFTNINTTFINSIVVAKDSNSTFNVVENAKKNTNEYIVSTNHNIQLSESRFRVVVTFKRNSSGGNITPNQLDSGVQTVNNTVPVTNQTVQLATMLVLGQQSGVFTTIDLFGTTGRAVQVPGGGNGNITPILVTDPPIRNPNSGGISIVGGNA